jgi:hypothetical protein
MCMRDRGAKSVFAPGNDTSLNSARPQSHRGGGSRSRGGTYAFCRPGSLLVVSATARESISQFVS